MKLFSRFLFLFIGISVYAQIPPGVPSGSYQEGVKVPGYGMPSSGGGMTIYQENKKYGVKNSGKITVAPQYDKLDFAMTSLIATKNNLKGVIDGNGKILLPLKYDDIQTDRVFFICKKGKTTEIFSSDLKPFVKGDFSRIILYNNEILVTEDYDGGQSFIFSNGTVVKNKYAEATVYNNLVVVKMNDKLGILKDGKDISGFVYDDLYFQRNMYDTKPKANKGITEIREGAKYLIGVKDKKFGLINHLGKTVLPFDYDKINLDYDKKSYYTFKNNQIGIFINETTKLEPQFKSVEKRDNNYIVSKSNKYVLLNTSLQQNPNLESDAPIETLLSSKFLKIKKNGKYGLTDNNGSLLIPFEYDGFDYLDYDRQHLITVKNNDKAGLFDLNQKKLIIPVAYEFLSDNDDFIIGFFKDKTSLFNYSGQKILTDDYDSVASSKTENSSVYFVGKDNLYTVITKDQKILMKDILSYRYIYNEDLLINPFLSNRISMMALQHKNGKYALFNEFEKKTVSNFEYDNIVQKYTADQLYFIVVKNKKYGVVDAQNKIIVDFIYDEMSFNKVYSGIQPLAFVAKKDNKYGIIGFNSTVWTPFKYDGLEKISEENLFKAKTGKTYQIINYKNEILNKNSFDDIAGFEGKQALTFSKGMMRVISNKGEFTGIEEKMQPHEGYKTFDELKLAFIQAMDSKDDEALKIFVKKTAPSPHILYFLKNNMFTREELYINESGLQHINKKYFEDLREFKYSMWNSIYNQNSLRKITDFTIHSRGFVTNARTEDHAFGDTRFLESVLRDAIKINGFWISSYFMSRKF
ncbi:WG repeat-containing protein [Chryseobacterium kwangjuense]|uniref:WG repeat-containing protein n=1 Tax=Chryseobacterium kwangjuense TaxID=267125 RepID=A0A135WD42_9FLAO|nr:WG repeat-containing protein [Chryseobacterium kwangjuense]KXH82844.1 hypothetical protein AU378_10380 [Chryseobacterium kwangjuense]